MATPDTYQQNVDVTTFIKQNETEITCKEGISNHI